MILFTQPALAGQSSSGVGIQSSPVFIGEPISANSTHKLNVSVYNTGTDNETVNLVIQNLSHRKTAELQPGWVKFSENNFSLGSGQSANVGITLTVPSVPNGYYSSDIWARTTGGNGLALGAGAATVIEFKVGGKHANFAQFSHPPHYTKKQLRKIRRLNRKLEHANTPSGGSGNGGINGRVLIGVAVVILGTLIVFRVYRNTVRHHMARSRKNNKNKDVKAYKKAHDDKQAKKERNRKMREGK